MIKLRIECQHCEVVDTIEAKGVIFIMMGKDGTIDSSIHDFPPKEVVPALLAVALEALAKQNAAGERR